MWICTFPLRDSTFQLLILLIELRQIMHLVLTYFITLVEDTSSNGGLYMYAMRCLFNKVCLSYINVLHRDEAKFSFF